MGPPRARVVRVASSMDDRHEGTSLSKGALLGADAFRTV